MQFFGHGVKKLTPAEGAYLAGRIQQPDRFDVDEEKKDFSGTQFRFNYVVKQMAEIDPAKYGGVPDDAEVPEAAPSAGTTSPSAGSRATC